MLVEEIMKTAMAINRDISLKEASELISSRGICSLIFMKNKKIDGILTEEDLIENFGKAKRISQVMSKNIVNVSPHDKTSKAIELMKEHKIGVLPVMEKDQLVGVVTAKDLLIDADGGGEFLFD